MDLNSLTGTSIALVLLYLQLALAVSAFTELVSSVMEFRSQDLDRWLTRNLGERFANELRKHPLMEGAPRSRWTPDLSTVGPQVEAWLKRREWRRPSWVDPTSFAKAVVATRNALQAAASAEPPDPDKAPLAQALADARRLGLLDASGAEESYRHWFETGMEHLKGEYARWARWMNLLTAFVLAALLNADTFQIIKELPSNEAANAVASAAAAEIVARGLPSPGAPDEDTQAQAEQAAKKLRETIDSARASTLLGWSDDDKQALWSAPWTVPGIGAWLMKTLGLLTTALATSLGAPFWFDLLKKFVGAPAAAAPEPAKK